MPMKFPARYVPCLIAGSATLHAAAPGNTTVTLCNRPISDRSGVSTTREPYCEICDAHMNQSTRMA